jgi:hypothetical protein
MARSSRFGLLAVAVLLLLGARLYLGSRPAVTNPDDLIRASLDDAAAAARHGDVGGIMDSVSDDFHAAGWNKARLRLLLNRTITQGRGTDYDVHVNLPTIRPSPVGRSNERLVITRFAAFYTGSGEDIYKSNDAVMLVMRAETRRRYLVFSEPRWRIVSILNPPALPGGGGDDLGI